MLPLIKYSVMRLTLFVVVMGLLYLVGIQGLLSNLLLAGVISLLLSYVLLRRPREELAQQISDRVSGRLVDKSSRSGVEADAAYEDAVMDEQDAGQDGGDAGQDERDAGQDGRDADQDEQGDAADKRDKRRRS